VSQGQVEFGRVFENLEEARRPETVTAKGNSS
jgi:hypothetical protein